MCIPSFNNDDEFNGIPMFLNPLYSSLHCDDPIHNVKIARYSIKMFDESVDPIFDIQTLNLKTDVLDSIDVFSIRCKANLFGWKVLRDCNQFFWVLIGPFPSPYAFLGWKFSDLFLHNVFQVINLACKENNAFLYSNCHPT
jgi:hypothetical protein